MNPQQLSNLQTAIEKEFDKNSLQIFIAQFMQKVATGTLAEDAFLKKPTKAEGTFFSLGGTFYQAVFSCGSYIGIQRLHHGKHAGWDGQEKRVDQNGQSWSGPINRYVVDDFGSLVQVAT